MLINTRYLQNKKIRKTKKKSTRKASVLCIRMFTRGVDL